MIGILHKTLREVWIATLLFGVGVLLAETLLNFILPQIQDEISEIWLSMPIAQSLIGGLLGVDMGKEINALVMQSIVWVHPVVLALLWAHEIMFCTRMPAGEIDRGTVDVLLGLPVSRRAVYAVESAVWVVSGLLLMVLAFTGYVLGSADMLPENRPATARIVLVLANLYCVYLAVGGAACLVSAASNRRGRAVGAVFTIVVASFLLNFLAQFWAPAQRVAFLSVLDYYQPAGILRDGTIPWRDLGVLLAFAGVTWAVAGEVVARRSMCTV